VALLDAWTEVRIFLETGGNVLLGIGVVTFWMWILIAERGLYALRGARAEVQRAVESWQARRDRSSWYAEQVRRLLISEVRMRLSRGIPMIKTLVALCPLLGLLGTVTGMIEVFEVMAVAGSGNPRAMASGVSKATIPTMAGMVAALSGLVISVRLDRWAAEQTEKVADRLTA